MNLIAAIAWVGMSLAGAGAEMLSKDQISEMKSSSWRDECPIGLDELRLVKVRHLDFNGHLVEGELVVHRDLATEVREIFVELEKLRYPIALVSRVEHFKGSDDDSMAANNTSVFNCRVVPGSKKYSKHAYGRAIDINPIQNPYIKGTTILPPAGNAFADRSQQHPALIKKNDAIYHLFVKRGWKWGGNWRTLKDYQHFEK